MLGGCLIRGCLIRGCWMCRVRICLCVVVSVEALHDVVTAVGSSVSDGFGSDFLWLPH